MWANLVGGAQKVDLQFGESGNDVTQRDVLEALVLTDLIV